MPEFSDYLESLALAGPKDGSEIIGCSQSGNARALTTDLINNWRGAYDLSVNAYPSSGGTGASGVPAPGNEWYVSVPGDVDVTGLGVITLYYGALLKYLGGTVSSASSWKVTQ